MVVPAGASSRSTSTRCASDFGAAGTEDLAASDCVRGLLRDAVGESTFAIWLAPLSLIAVDLEGALVVSAPPETVGWVARRFGRVLDAAAQRAGRGLRLADEVERKAAETLAPPAAAAANAVPPGLSADARSGGRMSSEPCPADPRPAMSVGSLSDGLSGRATGRSVGGPGYGSVYPCSYTVVYTRSREVS